MPRDGSEPRTPHGGRDRDSRTRTTVFAFVAAVLIAAYLVVFYIAIADLGRILADTFARVSLA